MPICVRLRARAVVAAIVLMLASVAAMPEHARASACSNDGSGFDAWLNAFKQRAARQGVSQ